jgi:hypothetical protein
LTAVAEVLKARFNNLTVAETIRLTVAVMDAVKDVENTPSDRVT